MHAAIAGQVAAKQFISTVKSCKLEVLRTSGLFKIISSSNYKKADIKVFVPKNDSYQGFFSIKLML